MSAIDSGAAIGGASGIPFGAEIGGVVGAVSGLFGGGGTPDQMKAIWTPIPANVIRITGGHGKWTDTLTGEQLTDAQTDVRKGAVISSAINAYNDLQNHWYDASTGQYIDGATALNRWNAKFGAGASFAAAYAAQPQAFTVYGQSSANDPQHTKPVAPVVPVSYPAPTSPASQPATNGGAAGTGLGVGGNVPIGAVPPVPYKAPPIVGLPATPAPTGNAPAAAATPFYKTTAGMIAIAAGVLVVGYLAFKHRG